MFDKLIDLLTSSIHMLMFWTVVQPYEQAVRMRLGEFREVLDPGFHWKMPFAIDYVHTEHVVPKTERLSSMATTTTDGRNVGFDAVITYRINDIKKAVLEVEDVRDSIADACAGVIGTALAGATWEDIRTGTVVDQLTAACRKRGWKWGIEIQAVQLTGISLVKNIRVSISGQTHHGNMTVNNVF
jgi:regulator of protease activity HflC (stomatin/prohibitin superfamily)